MTVRSEIPNYETLQVRKPIRYVYVAGPLSQGGYPKLQHNLNQAFRMGRELIECGFVPYVPHQDHVWNLMVPMSYEDWMQLDFAWVEKCDAVVRLPGESPGADREVQHAKARGIPVFESLEALLEAANKAIGD